MSLYRRDDDAWWEQVRQNAARPATVQAFTSSTGWGEFQIGPPLMFDATFIEEPVVTHGCALDGDTLVALRFPRTSGGVYRWVQDEKGFWTGAHVFVIVDTLSPANIAGVPATDPGYTITHSFVFRGIAIKDIDQEDQAELP